MQYQHILYSFNTAISKSDCMRKDQGEYLETLTILQQLTFS